MHLFYIHLQFKCPPPSALALVDIWSHDIRWQVLTLGGIGRLNSIESLHLSPAISERLKGCENTHRTKDGWQPV